MLVRFGEPLPELPEGVSFNDPSIIEREVIENANLTLSIYGVGWWDEKHIEQHVGSINDSMYQFGWDEHGLYSPDVEIEEKEVVSY